MAIDNLDVRCVLALPAKTRPVWIIDPNAVLAHSVSLEGLEPVSSDLAKILHGRCGPQPGEFDLGLVVNLLGEKPQRFFGASSIVDIFDTFVLEVSCAYLAFPIIPGYGIKVKGSPA